MDGTGGFVIAWDNGETPPFPIHAQKFDGAGAPVGAYVQLGDGIGVVIAKRDLGGYGAIWVPSSGGSVLGALIEGARFDDNLAPVGSVFELHDVNVTVQAFARTVAANNGRHLMFAWQDFTTSGTIDVVARRGGFPDGAPFQVDARAGGSTTGNLNGVLEVGERILVDQAYQNLSGAPYPLAGTASNWTGPAGLSFTIHDPAADYGTISGSAPQGDAPAGSTTADCFTATGNCFEFELTGTRTPGLHWDTTYDEALSEDVSVTRTLHLGGSFTDVPTSNQFYRFIETLFHTGVTGGCGAGVYCSTNPVTRGQMAVFLLKALEGITYDPPDCAGVFDDVTCTPGTGFSDFIEELFARQITGGCSVTPPLYCPGNPNNRGQMAVFLVKTFSLLLYGFPPPIM
jgi:hypothetical protein